jgi:two-component system sensor histidine kinase KdpD
VPVHAKNGHPLGTLCVLDTVPRTLSIRERQMLEGLGRELEMHLELRQMLLEQQRLFDERAVLTEMILHDASSIVAALRWNFKVLLDRSSDDTKVLGQCQSAADELMRLCESVTKTNDAQSRGIVVERASTELRTWFDYITHRAKREARDAGIEVDVENHLLKRLIETDAHLLERVVMNLVRNAIQASPSGSRLLITARSSDASALVFSVADEGAGVPEEYAQRIFEPYFSRRASGDRGMGLGLAFCRLATRALGGSIEFKPRQPRGAEFTVMIPAATQADP